MKIYPSGLEELLQEESKGSRIQIPQSFLRIISLYQLHHKKATGSTKLTREELVIHLMNVGIKEFENETAAFYEKAKGK